MRARVLLAVLGIVATFLLLWLAPFGAWR